MNTPWPANMDFMGFTTHGKASSKLKRVKKLRRLHIKSNHVMFLLMVVFLLLYLRDHSRLVEVEEQLAGRVEGREGEVRHGEVMEARRKRLMDYCEEKSADVRSSHGSLFHR